MIIPVPALWSRRRLFQPQDQIDQALHNRSHRLIAGVAIDSLFDHITGALVVIVGHGKYLRIRHVVDQSVLIPVALKRGCLEFYAGQNNDLLLFHSLLADLAAIEATLVERLKVDAGKYVDRILAVSVIDPGLWRTDFDGRISYLPFCDATRFAELSGVSVIDNFPAADLAVGGRGTPLAPLPLWLMLADRDAKIAKREKFLLTLGEPVQLLRLPISDGLDSDVPELELWQLEGSRFVRFSTAAELGRKQNEVNTDRPPKTKMSPDPAELIAALRPILETPSEDTVQELVCNFPFDEASTAGAKLVDHLTSSFPTVALVGTSHYGFSPAATPAVTAAVLGLMHIDQMPSNIPFFTCGESQRILGRLTLGRPSSYRQLIRAMADYQPAAMKLKDAI